MKRGLRRYVALSLTVAVGMSVSFRARAVEPEDVAASVNYCRQTKEEKAVSTALLINRNASSIAVGGARRYINNDNPKETPLIVDGSIYLPSRTLALALGCYHESLPGKNYVLIRDDKHDTELYFSSAGSYKQEGMGDKTEIYYRPVYKNGEVYLPVRAVAELVGKKVNYRDGIVAVDDEPSADRIVGDEAVFAYAKKLFDDFIPTDAVGNVYHVSPFGDEAATGTESNPMSLSKASSLAQAGDTVIIHEGVYREILKPLNDGAPTNPIVFKAAEGEKVVLTAANEISGFTDIGGGLLSADVPDALPEGKNQIFYKDECLVEARYPDGPQIDMGNVDSPLSPLFPIQGDLKVNPEDRTIVTSDTLLRETEKDYWKGAAFVSVHGFAYSASAAKVSASEQGKLTLTDLPKVWWHDATENDIWNFGYLTGHKNAINLPGEWVVEGGRLIIMPPAGETASTLKLEMKARPITMDLSGVKFVQVRGIESIGGGAKLNNSEMCMLNDVDMKYISHYTYSDDQREGFIDKAIDSTNADSDDAKKGAPSRGEVGVYISGRDNAVINSSFDHSAASALYLTGLYTYIDNNIISNCGYAGSYVSGITVYNEPWLPKDTPRGGFAIYNNTLYNSGRYLFICQGCEFQGIVPFLPFEVAYNDFHDASLFTLDVGYTYLYWANVASEKTKSRLHSNYVYSTSDETNPYSFGIYCDGGSVGLDCYNNMVFTTKAGTEFTSAYTYKNALLSFCTLSSNSQLKKPVIGGISALEAEDFPKNKPFYAGVLKNTPRYMSNYNRTDETVFYAPIGSAEKIGSFHRSENGGLGFKAKDTESSLTFKNVHFENGVNQLVLYYGGTSASRNLISVILQSSTGASEVYQVYLTTTPDTDYQTDFETIDLDIAEGVYDITVKSDIAEEITYLYGISATKNGNITSKGYNCSKINAADFTRIYKYGVSGTLCTEATAEKYVRNTYKGATLLYKNVEFDKAVSYISFSACTDKAYNLEIQFILDNPDGAPIYTANIPKTGFGNPEETSKMIQAIPKGTHDVYIKFLGNGTSDFYSFGFSAE